MKKRNSLFDSVKGIAILGIMMIHICRANLTVNNTAVGNIISAGLLGVEITYFLNAFFYSRSYDKKVREEGMKINVFIFKMVERILPCTYLMILVLCVSNIVANGNIGTTPVKLVAQLLFINGFTSYWFNAEFGLGYVGILVLMWVVFPIYLKRIKSLEESIIYSVIACSLAFVVVHLLSKCNEYVHFDSYENFLSWLDYIKRAVISYSLGNVFFYLDKEKDFLKRISRYRWAVTFSCGLLMVKKIIENGSQYSGFLFVLIWMMILLVNNDKSIWVIDNKVFSFLGKYSYELYLTHVALIKILIDNQKVFSPSLSAAIGIFCCQ